MSGQLQRVCALCDFGMARMFGVDQWRCTNEKCERSRPPELAGAKYDAEAEAARTIVTPSEAREQAATPTRRTESGLILPGGFKR